MIAAKGIVIAPNWGGQLEYLNDHNSLLISGKEIMANPRAMYWESKLGSYYFDPNITDAVDKLKYAYLNTETLKSLYSIYNDKLIDNYSWNNISTKIIKLCQ